MGGNWSEPGRWSDDPFGGPEGAAGLLRGALRPRPPSERELARLAAKVDLMALTAETARPPFGTWRGFGTRPSRAVAVGAGLLLTVSMLGTAVALWRASDGHRSPEVVQLPLRIAPLPRSAPAATARRSERVATPVSEQVTAHVSAIDRHAAARRARHPALTAAPAESLVDQSLLREAALIDQARGALATDPAQALALLERDRREAPDGQLSPEREFLSVAALCSVGQLDEASRRAAALDRRKPASTYAARARRLVQAARGGAARVQSDGRDGLTHQSR